MSGGVRVTMSGNISVLRRGGVLAGSAVIAVEDAEKMEVRRRRW